MTKIRSPFKYGVTVSRDAFTNRELKLTSASVMQDYELGTPRNLSKNRTVLLQKDIIQKAAKGYEFLDPGFELWFRGIFLGQIRPDNSQL